RRYRIAPAPQDEVVEQEGKKKTEEVKKEDKKTQRQQQMKCLGFPNPAQICYLNSCLQSLLTLEDFVKAIAEQEQVWSLIPEAAIMRTFVDINRSHLSSDERHKIWLLAAFKGAISVWAPEFQDLHQKDAHEFLTAVLEQMRYLGPELQMMAESVGGTYSCPVTEHMVFKMNNTRTCKSCSAESTREEEFTNLSLDLIPGRSTVEDPATKLPDSNEHFSIFIPHFNPSSAASEKELEYTCECGATMSGQRSSFKTLPRVLVLHLKRFRFTPTYQPEKIQDPVVLLRDLTVSSSHGGACYSLVSTISHLGPTTRSGHYICDGVDPDLRPEDLTDRWFTYNDAKVTETSSAFVCDQRERDAYILFYKRHVS
ncbi:hypothetical protein L3Q82_025740, partial [Scortum barcoo]